MLPDIKSLTREELEAQFKSWALPAYRAGQVLDWLYVRRATSWDAMTNLPKPLREQLRGQFSLATLELVRQVTSGKWQVAGTDDDRQVTIDRRLRVTRHLSPVTPTQKFLWRLADHALIESVLIPANPALYGDDSDRHTLCISTQVGCAYGCRFCASGLDGWKRNLGVHEIVEQVLAVERNRPPSKVRSPETRVGADSSADSRLRTADSRLVDNVVVMGMGEPLANYENLLKALKILNAPWGGGIGARKITISTSGLVPQIRRLAAEPLQFRLAISLHGATDTVRNRIMPVNKKYPLRELTAACEDYQARKGRMITFEYILIAGVNDSLEQTKPLAALAKKLFAKVNLIPYNRVEGLPWDRPEEAVCEAFLRALEKQKVTATLRREKGGDIDAACGQLRLKTERELASIKN